MKFRMMMFTGLVFSIAVVVLFLVLVSVSYADATTISVQPITLSGITPVYSDAVAGGVQFANDGRIFLHLTNTNGASRAVTITTPYQEGGLDLADVYVTLEATTGDVMVGPFPPKLFNNSGGFVQVNFSAISDVKVAAIKLP